MKRLQKIFNKRKEYLVSYRVGDTLGLINISSISGVRNYQDVLLFQEIIAENLKPAILGKPIILNIQKLPL